MIGSASLLARRSGQFPRWLATGGLVFAPLLGVVTLEVLGLTIDPIRRKVRWMRPMLLSLRGGGMRCATDCTGK